MALYVSDSWRKDKPFGPIGFELFLRLRQRFEPIDIIAVTGGMPDNIRLRAVQLCLDWVPCGVVGAIRAGA